MKKFGTLRFIATLCRILAWVALVGGLLGSLLAIVVAVIGGRIETPALSRMQPYMSSTAGAVLLGLFIVAAALVAFLVLQAEADVITLGLSIEENTRTTAELLKGEAALNANGVPWDPSA